MNNSKNPVSSIQFASFLLFILLLQVAIAVYAFVVIKNNDDHIDIREGYTKLFESYYINQSNKQVVDTVQAGVSVSSRRTNRSV